MSSALKALNSGRKLMQNTWISISSIQSIPSIILVCIRVCTYMSVNDT